MINWKKCAEYDLKDYLIQREAIGNLTEKILQTEARMTRIRSSMRDSVPVHGGASSYEDDLLTAIVEKARLEDAKQATVHMVAMTERGLSALSEEQRRVLQIFFMNGGGYRRVMAELNIEQAEAYRRRDAALRAFTIAMYGVTEL